MLPSLTLPLHTDKTTIYRELLLGLSALIEGEPDFIANLANITALIKQAFPNVSWVGFYRKIGEELVLGPFQGKIACTRIGFGRGVCGAAVQRRVTIIVDNVDHFPGHIACDEDSRSEIVVPIVRGEQVLGVLDLDSARLANFDAVDAEYLGKIAEVVTQLNWSHSSLD